MQQPMIPPSRSRDDESAAVPVYLEQNYWWAYVHPRSVRIFEREWLVNLILFGNYARLRDAAIEALQLDDARQVLQLACVYGDLTPRLLGRLRPGAGLEVLDILPIQLKNLSSKLGTDPRVRLTLGDAAELQHEDGSVDRTLLFFLLHEQPEDVRRATLAEALRVLKPGGRLVVVDYHRPSSMHPLRPLMRQVFGRLEPFAMDLWQHPLEEFLPRGRPVEVIEHRTWFGGLYQLWTLRRA